VRECFHYCRTQGIKGWEDILVIAEHSEPKGERMFLILAKHSESIEGRLFFILTLKG